MSAAIGRPATVTSDWWEGTLVPVFPERIWRERVTEFEDRSVCCPNDAADSSVRSL